MRNLAAWTPPIAFPPYVSINLHEGRVVLVVRGDSESANELGTTAQVSMPREEFALLMRDVFQRLLEGGNT